MRFILSMALVAAATSLVCHGYFHREDAQAALAAANDKGAFEKVTKAHPYSLPAVDARRRHLELSTKKPPAETDEGLFAHAWKQVSSGVNLEKAPWIMPPAAGVIALAGLLLALFLPGTRFRSLALMTLLAGGVALMPSLTDPRSQVELTDAFGPAGEAIAWSPFIAAGLMILAAFALGPRRRAD